MSLPQYRFCSLWELSVLIAAGHYAQSTRSFERTDEVLLVSVTQRGLLGP